MIVVVFAFVIFGYIIVQRALQYWTFPKTVTIEVVYRKAMPYPVVTICNQNFFRYDGPQPHCQYLPLPLPITSHNPIANTCHYAKLLPDTTPSPIPAITLIHYQPRPHRQYLPLLLSITSHDPIANTCHYSYPLSATSPWLIPDTTLTHYQP